MNKKSLLGLILFACIVISGMFFGTMIMIKQPAAYNYNQNSEESSNNENDKDFIEKKENEEYTDNDENQPLESHTDGNLTLADADLREADSGENFDKTEGIESDKPINENEEVKSEDKIKDKLEDKKTLPDSKLPNEESVDETGGGIVAGKVLADTDDINTIDETEDVLSGSIVELPDMQLITDSSQVDYMKYIPEMIYDSKIEVALDIDNPSIDIKAKSAIVFDVKTRKVLYYKDPILPVFPASTAKLLTSLVALDWCMEEEEVTVGDELDLVAPDSTKAGLKKGQVLSIRNLIEGMLVPSGNDAAYVIAAYVGRKSLKDENASLKEAIPEFIRLMNDKAKSLGTINSCFKTPDGYDAIGQYTTAYDMGLIGLAAAVNEVILEVCSKSKARNVFVDGYDVTWINTNSLIKKDSGKYYKYCIGLKTGTSTMAGRCLISLAKKGDKEVISVVMNSNSAGRWEDSKKLLEYGLSN